MCEGHEHGHAHHDHDVGHVHADPATDFRLVLTGKGGVGKTSLTAVLARLLARTSHRVLALDADPQMNLPYALGLPPRAVRSLVPLSQSADYVEEKTGARPGSGWGLFLRLNPDVHDVVERFGVVGPDGVRLVVMGTVVQPATGCLCPENQLLASVAAHVSLRRGEAILMDTQAGVEHFGRSLARGFGHAAVVSDATFNGIQVALHAARLAQEIGIPKVHLVINRVRGARDIDRVRRLLDEEAGFAFASQHMLPFDERVASAEPSVTELWDGPPSAFVESVEGLRSALVRSQQELESCAS